MQAIAGYGLGGSTIALFARVGGGIFTKAAERKAIHRQYFAIEDTNTKEENGQLNYFLELAYWVMALSKPDKKKDKLAIYTKTLIMIKK